jgi:hypothetical protein
LGSPLPQIVKEQKLDPLKIKMSATSKYEILQQKEVQESHKTLGIYKIGNEREQYTQLLEKSNDLANKATKSQSNDKEAWLAYTYYSIPAITYSLTAVNMAETQLINIQKTATTQFSRMCGFE